MTDWVGRRRAGEIPDRLTLLVHPPVITYGSRTPPAELPARLTVPLVPVDRGGRATYHGPGQLIGYLVLNLCERGPGGIVRRVENGLIAACADLGFETVRRDTRPAPSRWPGSGGPTRPASTASDTVRRTAAATAASTACTTARRPKGCCARPSTGLPCCSK